MLDPHLLRGAFRIGVLIFLLAAIMLPFQERDSAEFVVTTLALLVGLAFVTLIALLARGASPRPPSDNGPAKRYNRRDSAREGDQ